MLVIRMKRVGRSGHAQFRIVVQDSRQSPKSGKFVAHLGSYDPHTKKALLDKEKAQLFIKNGAQPSERATLILKQEGIKLPDWVKTDSKKAGTLRNPDKLRRNRPDEPKQPEAVTEPTAEASEPVEDTPASEEPAVTDVKTDETPETSEIPAEADAAESAEPEANESESENSEETEATTEPKEESEAEA